MWRRADIPTSDTYKFVPEGVWQLFHGTPTRNVPKILSEGLKPLSVGQTEFAKEPLIWASTSPDVAYHHAKNRNPDEEISVVSFTVNTDEFGIHKFIGSDEVFNLHESIPPELISVEYEEGMSEETFGG